MAYLECTSEPAARSEAPLGRAGAAGRANPREAACGMGRAAEEHAAESEYWYAVLVRSDGDGGVLEESRLRLTLSPNPNPNPNPNQVHAAVPCCAARGRSQCQDCAPCAPQYSEAVAEPPQGQV